MFSSTGKPIPWDVLREMAAELPYQRVKDSPTIPSYTDWKRLSLIEEADYASKAVEPPLPGGVEPDTMITPRGVETSNPIVQALARESLEAWHLPVENRLDAVHALRWRHGVSITRPGQAVVAIVGGADGYHGTHVELHVPQKGKLSVAIIAYTPPTGPLSYTLNASVTEGSELELVIVEVGRGPVKADAYISLAQKAKATVRLLTVAGQMTRMKVAARQDSSTVYELRAATISTGSKLDLITDAHARGDQPRTTIHHRGYVSSRAIATHRGTAHVASSARHATAVVDTLFTLLDDTATAVAVPVLEVDTGEVDEARHSALISQPDPTTTFYLRQRGLTPAEALTLQVIGAIEEAGIPRLLGVEPSALYEWVRTLTEYRAEAVARPSSPR